MTILSFILLGLLLICASVLVAKLIQHGNTKKECKQLSSQIDQLTAQNESLKTTVNDLNETREEVIIKETNKMRNQINSECSLKMSQYKENVDREAEEKIRSIEEDSKEKIRLIEEECSQKVKETQIECSNKIKQTEKDLDEAVDEQLKIFKLKIDLVDEALGLKIEDIRKTNTMYFTCVCDKTKEIPCEIDLSTEDNYFTCQNCGAVWRVDVSAYPVLISNVSGNTTLASIMDRLEEYEELYEDLEPTIDIEEAIKNELQ